VPSATPAVPPGMLEVEFANGARLRITGTVDPALVTAMLAALAGRSA